MKAKPTHHQREDISDKAEKRQPHGDNEDRVIHTHLT